MAIPPCGYLYFCLCQILEKNSRHGRSCSGQESTMARCALRRTSCSRTESSQPRKTPFNFSTQCRTYRNCSQSSTRCSATAISGRGRRGPARVLFYLSDRGGSSTTLFVRGSSSCTGGRMMSFCQTSLGMHQQRLGSRFRSSGISSNS